jgi:hypothetical protein
MAISAKKQVVIGILVTAFCLLVLGLGLGLGLRDNRVPLVYNNSAFMTQPDVQEIEIISDNGFIFTKPGETATLSARLREGDVGEFNFTSSNPLVATVDQNGVITCMTEEPSSAMVYISSGDRIPAVATVVVAKLAPDVIQIPSDQVWPQSTTSGPDQVALSANDLTRGITVGKIVVSGSKGGLFHRVVDPSPVVVGDRVILNLVPVESITDVFEILRFAGSTALLPVEIQ